MAHVPITAILRSTVGTVLLLLLAITGVALTTSFVVAEAPDGTRTLDAYNAAPRCPAAPSAPAECRWTQEFTVTNVHRTHKRSEMDGALLTDADGREWKTSYVDNGPVLDDMDKGDQVTGTIWRGHVTEVAMNGASQDTDAAPDDLRARYLIGGLIIIPPALLLAAVCVWRLGRRAAPNPTPGMRATFGLTIALLFAGLFSPVLASAAGEKFWAVAAVWLPLAAVLTIATRVYVVRQRPRDADAASGVDGRLGDDAVL